MIIIWYGAILTKSNTGRLKVRYSIRFKMHKLGYTDYIENSSLRDRYAWYNNIPRDSRSIESCRKFVEFLSVGFQLDHYTVRREFCQTSSDFFWIRIGIWLQDCFPWDFILIIQYGFYNHSDKIFLFHSIKIKKMFYFFWTTCACLMISKNRASFPLHDKYMWYYKNTHKSPVLKFLDNLCIFALADVVLKYHRPVI